MRDRLRGSPVPGRQTCCAHAARGNGTHKAMRLNARAMRPRSKTAHTVSTENGHSGRPSQGRSCWGDCLAPTWQKQSTCPCPCLTARWPSARGLGAWCACPPPISGSRTPASRSPAPWRAPSVAWAWTTCRRPAPRLAGVRLHTAPREQAAILVGAAAPASCPARGPAAAPAATPGMWSASSRPGAPLVRGPGTGEQRAAPWAAVRLTTPSARSRSGPAAAGCARRPV